MPLASADGRARDCQRPVSGVLSFSVPTSPGGLAQQGQDALDRCAIHQPAQGGNGLFDVLPLDHSPAMPVVRRRTQDALCDKVADHDHRAGRCCRAAHLRSAGQDGGEVDDGDAGETPGSQHFAASIAMGGAASLPSGVGVVMAWLQKSKSPTGVKPVGLIGSMVIRRFWRLDHGNLKGLMRAGVTPFCWYRRSGDPLVPQLGDRFAQVIQIPSGAPTAPIVRFRDSVGCSPKRP